MPTIREKTCGHSSYPPPSELAAVVEQMADTQQRLSRRLGRVLFGTAVLLLFNIGVIVYSGGHLSLLHSAVPAASAAGVAHNGSTDTGADSGARKGA